MVMLVNFGVFWNAALPMLVRLLDAEKLTLVRLAEFENAATPMLVTPLGIVMLVNLLP
jgi:hypothetical protein